MIKTKPVCDELLEIIAEYDVDNIHIIDIDKNKPVYTGSVIYLLDNLERLSCKEVFFEAPVCKVMYSNKQAFFFIKEPEPKRVTSECFITTFAFAY